MPSLQHVITPLFTFIFAIILYAALPAFAANYPETKEGSRVAKNFKFHAGEMMPEVTLHYRTIGNAKLYKKELAEVPDKTPRR